MCFVSLHFSDRICFQKNASVGGDHREGQRGPCARTISGRGVTVALALMLVKVHMLRITSGWLGDASGWLGDAEALFPLRRAGG